MLAPETLDLGHRVQIHRHTSFNTSPVVGRILAVAVKLEVARLFTDVVNQHALYNPEEGDKPSLAAMQYLILQTEQTVPMSIAIAYPWIDFAASASLESTVIYNLKLFDVTAGALASVRQHLNTLGVRHQLTILDV